MPADPITTSKELQQFLQSMADDELVLGHRDAEWTGFAPILEEDIAFSNIAQDEMGHSIVWYSLLEQMTGRSPDEMAFERDWTDFRCCRFVSYPIGDFAYTVVRQFLFDGAEAVRLKALSGSSVPAVQEAAMKIATEETYHLMHSKGLVERLGNATEESHRRMQAAVDSAFPQSIGVFEELEGDDALIQMGVFPGNTALKIQWLERVVPMLTRAGLEVPVKQSGNDFQVLCEPENGGRKGDHNEHLQALVSDLQSVYRSVPGGNW